LNNALDALDALDEKTYRKRLPFLYHYPIVAHRAQIPELDSQKRAFKGLPSPPVFPYGNTRFPDSRIEAFYPSNFHNHLFFGAKGNEKRQKTAKMTCTCL
jgi:hypothetical protein